LYGEAAEYFYGRCLHVSPKFVQPPGYITEGTQRMGIQSQVSQAASANYTSKLQSTAKEMHDIVDRGYIIIGSPDEVAEQIRAVAKDLHVGHLLMLFQFGNLSKERTRYNTKLFAEKVMPQIKDIFSEWEDKWWPTPLAAKDPVGTSPLVSEKV